MLYCQCSRGAGGLSRRCFGDTAVDIPDPQSVAGPGLGEQSPPSNAPKNRYRAASNAASEVIEFGVHFRVGPPPCRECVCENGV